MVETGHAFYQPGEKSSDADLMQSPYTLHNKCSLIVRDRDLLMMYKSDYLVNVHLWLKQVAHLINQGIKFVV